MQVIRKISHCFSNTLKTQKVQRYNILLYFLSLVVIYFNFWLFFQIIGRPILTFKWLQSEALHLVTCIVLSLPYFFLRKRKGLFFILIFIVDFYLISNMMYYRTYYTIMPLSSFTMVENLNGLEESIISSVRLIDVLFLLPSIFLLVFYWGYLGKRMVEIKFLQRLKYMVLMVLFSGLVIGYNLYSCRNDKINLLKGNGLFEYDVVNGTWNYGFLHFWIFQLSNSLDDNGPLTAKDKNYIEGWMAEHQQSLNGQLSRKPISKNIILILVESLESFPIGARISDAEITPNINALLKSEHCLYASHVLPQVKDGRSSDSQLIINSGLLPINSGATCFLYPQTFYFTLPKALKCHGYTSHTLVGGEASYWNQSILNETMGYDDLISIKDYRADECYDFGLTDSSFLSQSYEKLLGFSQPFFSQLITLSSHLPFNLPGQRVYFKSPKDCPSELSSYFNAIHYTDRFLGVFISELQKKGIFENSIIIITGDHEAFDHKPFINDKYGKKLLEKDGYVPLIVLNSDKNLFYPQTMGQIDIYSTLIDILGLGDYQWQGVGASIFDKSKKCIAVNSKMEFYGDMGNVTEEEYNHAISAWNVSDRIIRKNYFQKKDQISGKQ